jgi:hypothetical protein
MQAARHRFFQWLWFRSLRSNLSPGDNRPKKMREKRVSSLPDGIDFWGGCHLDTIAFAAENSSLEHTSVLKNSLA